MTKHLLSLCLFLFLSSGVDAQEFNCKVKITAMQLQIADASIFENLENDLFEFMNNRRWTNDDYREEERINVNISMNISEELSATRFRADLIINADRPIFNTSYTSQIFRHQDKEFEFVYAPFSALDFDLTQFQSNLTSVLAFYAYTILGLDGDSFASEGGTPYFLNAKTIVEQATNSSFKGWRAFENNLKRNRYWLNENLLNSRFRDLRIGYYKYHRKGLDVMFDDLEGGRKQVTQALEMVGKSNKENPNSMLVKVFFNTKGDEIINIFKDTSVGGKEYAQVLNVVSKADPGTSRKLGSARTQGRTNGMNGSQGMPNSSSRKP